MPIVAARDVLENVLDEDEAGARRRWQVIFVAGADLAASVAAIRRNDMVAHKEPQRIKWLVAGACMAMAGAGKIK